MLDDKELLNKNTLFNVRKNRKEKTAYEKAKNFYFVLSIILSLFIIGLTYFISDVSDIYRITVDGNEYLKDEEIISLSGLSEHSKYILINPKKAERAIRENELIESASVKRLEGRLVRIEVKEKKIVGYAMENGLNVLILEDGERIGLSKENLYLISSGPIITGFDEEEMKTLVKQIAKCDSKTIREISEIHNYPLLKYQNVELIMRDGNYVFTSVYGVDILEHYFDIESSYLSNERRCYYFEDISGNAYTSACPWEKIEEEEKEEQDSEDYESYEEDE